MWQYEALKNWGFGVSTFVLDFVDSSYPLQTNQGKWMNDLIEFHVETLLRVKVGHVMSHGHLVGLWWVM